ncbi:MAG: DUF262 domain-containing protein [Candidatus Nitrosocosmicus sp.]
MHAKTLWETDPTKSKNEIEVISKYGKIFHPEKIDELSAEEFKSFLNFKNNKHWTGLERAGYRLTEDMNKLKKTLKILLDESLPIQTRIKRIRDKNSPDYLSWFGTAFYTPVLLVVYPNKYPVVNAIVKNAIQKAGLYFEYDSKPEWEAYTEVSKIIINLAQQNNISLWQVDWVWWEINKFYDYEKLHSFILKITNVNELGILLVIRGFLEKDCLSNDDINSTLNFNSTRSNEIKTTVTNPIKNLIDEGIVTVDDDNNEYKLNMIQPLDYFEKEKLLDDCDTQISVLRENQILLSKNVSEIHVKILDKFYKYRGKYLEAERIYGVKKSTDNKKSPLPADDLVDKPHYLHNLITGVYWITGEEYALSIQLNPKSKWELEIDRDYPTLRINYDFGSDQKYSTQINKLKNCYSKDIPIGIIFKTGKSKNKILGLGKVSSIVNTKFVIDSYRVSEEESRKLKEETISEFDKSMSDPEIARIDPVNYKQLLSETNFNATKFLHTVSKSPDTRRIRIDQILDYCDSGEWVIPKFQRYFDWRKEDVRDFLKSIFLNYYVGSLLLWDVRKEEELDVMAIYGVDNKTNLIKNSIILDGQQRITSLYYAINSPEYSLTGDNKKRSFFYIDFNVYFTSNDTENLIKVSFEKIDEGESFRKMLFPFYCLSNPYPWLDKFESYLEIQEESLRPHIKILKRIIENKLRYIFNNFEIPYVTLPDDRSLEQVTEIFEKINSSGKQLDIFDLLIARLSKYKINLRELWEESRKNPKIIEYEGRRGEKKLPLYILQSLALCYSKSKSCKRKDILNVYDNIAFDKTDFENKWRIITSHTVRAINLLEDTKDGFGVTIPTELPFEPIIPVLTSLLKEIDEKYRDLTKKCFEKLENWYWTSVFSLAYSSAVDSQKTSDFKEMIEWFSNDDSIPKGIKDFRSKYYWQVDLKNVETESNAIYRGILSLIAIKGGKDFDKNRSIVHQKYHKDHIFPKSRYSHQENVNSILNITWLTSDTNQRIKRSKNLSTYINTTIEEKFDERENEFLETLNTHFIDNEAYLAMKENKFENFITAREKTILKEIGKRIGADNYEDGNNLPSMTTPYTPYTNIKIIRKALEECKENIYWIDKYFSLSDLDILSEANLTGRVKEIKVLISLKSSDERMRNNFIRFKKEMKSKDIECEMRVVADSKTYSEYHDRWILSKNVNYNLMSGDVAKRGQYAEIKKTENTPPFEKWWENSLDIINNLDEITKNRQRSMR